MAATTSYRLTGTAGDGDNLKAARKADRLIRISSSLALFALVGLAIGLTAWSICKQMTYGNSLRPPGSGIRSTLAASQPGKSLQ